MSKQMINCAKQKYGSNQHPLVHEKRYNLIALKITSGQGAFWHLEMELLKLLKTQRTIEGGLLIIIKVYRGNDQIFK